jgi:hypothetical protein
MRRFLGFIIERRVWFLALTVLITLASGYSISRGVVASSVANLFLGESPAFQRYKERVRVFGNDELLIIGIEDEGLLTGEGLARLERAVERVRGLPDVAYVDSVLDVPRIRGEDGLITIESYVRALREGREDAATLRRELAEDPLAGGLVISRDGRHGAVVVELTFDQDRPAERGPSIVEAVLRIFREAGYAPEQLHRTGYLAMLSEIMVQTVYSLTRLLPLVVIVLGGSVYLLFRRFWPVLITMGVSFIAAIWTMGFAVLLDRNINVLLAMVPAVVLIVSFSDVIHLCSAYLLELGRGEPKAEAVRKSGEDVGVACLYTSLTTFVGFVALSLVPTPVFRQLGLVLGFGVAVALLLAMTLTPILFWILPAPRPWRRGVTSLVQDWLDRFLAGIDRLVCARPRLVAGVFLAAALIAAAGVAQLHIETEFTERLDEENSLRQDERFFQEHFAGATTLEAFIDAPPGRDLLDPEVFRAVAALESELAALPEVDSAVSLVDLMRLLHQELAPESAAELPGTREALAQYLLLLEMSEHTELERFVDFDRRTMRLALRLNVGGVRSVYGVGQQAERIAARVLPAGMGFEATGLIHLLGQWLDDILVGQRNGLIFAFVTIALMMIVGLRSVRVGLWSMAPNVIPILFLGGYLGWCWENVDSDTIAIGMIAIGIGVDDTIHFLMRLRHEVSRSGSTVAALHDTFHFSGRAIVMTSVILVAGFSPFMLSDYFSTHIMGTLLPFALIAALVADLFLTPALVRLGMIRFPAPRPQPVGDVGLGHPDHLE